MTIQSRQSPIGGCEARRHANMMLEAKTSQRCGLVASPELGAEIVSSDFTVTDHLSVNQYRVTDYGDWLHVAELP
jgi:hypothetical protein